MNHKHARLLLDVYVDGELDSARARQVEAHLATCEECRVELSRLGALLDAAAALRERTVQPRRDLWPSIQNRIERAVEETAAPAPAGARRGLDAWRRLLFPAWRLPLGAGAIALLLLAGGYSLHVWRQADHPVAPEVAGTGVTGADGLSTAAAEADQARADLEKMLREHGANWPANAGAVLAQNLQMLDLAIKESRIALEANPVDRSRQRSLLAIYQKQLDLLRWATRLIQQT